MAGRLAENIRAFRRQRSLTQAQLAEALGVTVGAVYKWENGLSQPELDMLVALADFFDASVDALLGYEMKDNRLHAAAERLRQYRFDKDRGGLAEAERALAADFDAAPDYRADALRFVMRGECAGVYDDLGPAPRRACRKPWIKWRIRRLPSCGRS